MKTHELKLDVKYFGEVKNGNKCFEIRKNDRDFQVGDVLELKAFKDGFYAKKGSSWHTMGSDCCFYTSEQADTIKVKVVSVLKPRTVNAKKYYGRGWRTKDSSVYISNFTVVDVLKEYFHTDKLPDGYVVLGIEVIE